MSAIFGIKNFLIGNDECGNVNKNLQTLIICEKKKNLLKSALMGPLYKSSEGL